MVVPLPAAANMALPLPVLVAFTAGVLVELVKDAGPVVAALAVPAGSSSMAPTTPATPAAAVLAIPRRVIPGWPSAGSADAPATGLADSPDPGSPPDLDSRRSIRACCSSKRARSSPTVGIVMGDPFRGSEPGSQP